MLPARFAWNRRLIAPIVRQLRQGITPDKIALTIAFGLVLGLFPILGATTLLCGLVALRLGLNQPIIQMVNYVVYPLQLLALIPFYRGGESLFGQPHIPLAIPVLIARFRAGAWAFVGDFGQIAVQGIVLWCLLAPPVAAAVYFTVRPALRALARRDRARALDTAT